MKLPRTFPAAFLLIVVVLLWQLGCCHYPKGSAKHLPGVGASSATSITVVAYGDTRTGPWGLGDNAKEAIHGKVVSDIFDNNASIDAVVFTGDAVMSNFILWKKDYWNCFFASSNRFCARKIPFYPSLGNHEVLPSYVPVLPLRTQANAATLGGSAAGQTASQEEKRRRVVEAYEAGEEPVAGLPSLSPATNIYVDTPHGRAELNKWAQGIRKGDAQAANNFGQFQRHLQDSFYKQPTDIRCRADAGTFHDDYLTAPQYAYLKPLVNDRSYYAVLLERNGVRVKLIALDTNCLDSKAQQEFFVGELKNFTGSIIIFGHHPPVAYPDPGQPPPSPWPWDMVPGWEFFREYLSNADGKKIALWIFGHVHNYQRWDASGGQSANPARPIMLIAGGGGAPLDPALANFEWGPPEWPKARVVSAYSHVRIEINSSALEVEVRGTTNESQKFQSIDRFKVALSSSGENHD